MEEKSEFPSLPSNYVTLLQLQERWAKEKQRKQKEEEEEKRELEKLKEEKGKEKTDSNARFWAGYRNAKVINRRIVEVAGSEAAEVEAVEEKEEEERRKLAKLKEEKGKTDSNPRFLTGYRNAKVITRQIVEVARIEAAEVEAVVEKEEEEKRELAKLKKERGKESKEKTDFNPRFRSGYRNAKMITRRIVEVARPEAAGVEVVEEKTGGGEVELKKKKKRKKKRNKNKKEGDMAGESENQALEGRGEKEDVSARSGSEKKEGRSDMRRRSENSVVAADRTVEIERKLGSMSVKEGTVNGGSVRRNVINRSDRRFEWWVNSGDQRRFGSRENWGKMVWVRKGEDSDGKGGGTPSSLY